MQYLSEQIGEMYESWKSGDAILISSPTGSGKSSFVLNKLLPYAAERKKHIVYICNRRILNDQLQFQKDHISDSVARMMLLPLYNNEKIANDVKPYFHVVTYQYCETVRTFPKFTFRDENDDSKLPRIVEIGPLDIMYYVFDEAHYFLCDSIFNPNTNFWAFVGNMEYGIRIFLTATPRPLQTFITGCSQGFSFERARQQMVDQFYRKASMKQELLAERNIFSEEIVESSLQKGQAKSFRYIGELCRDVNPYQEVFDKLDPAKCKSLIEPIKTDNCHLCYSHMTFWYFKEYSELLDHLKSASLNNKWLIFVDSEQDGIELQSQLNKDSAIAKFLSAKIIRCSKHGKLLLKEISEERRFSVPILITTSVMDCGVSIEDISVQNIVIAQHQKETFIQELGRTRIKSADNAINVYIKAYDAKRINGVYHSLDQKMRFILRFAQLNEISYVPTGYGPSDTSDGMHSVPMVSIKKAKSIIQSMTSTQNRNLVYFHPSSLGYGSRRMQSTSTQGEYNPILKELQYSKTAFLYIILAMHDYQAAMESYRKTKDDAFYVKHQLSWVGHPYQENHWVTYNQCLESLATFLDNSVGRWLDKEQQASFSRQCTELLLQFPIPPQKLQKDTSRFRNDPTKALGINRINKCFKELNVSYHLCSVQRGTEHKSQWILRTK